MKNLHFTKSVATGNDFIILDNKRRAISGVLPGLAKRLCDRRRSVGADGLVIIEGSGKADFRMRIFNPDGSEAEMCGNGSRCVALYAHTKRIAPKKMIIETLAGLIAAEVSKDGVKVSLPDPSDIRWNFCLMIGQCPYEVSFANTGVPHVVHIVKDIDNIDVRSLGRDIRYHEDFSPSGANVNFVRIAGRDEIKVRTYERGVEDETLACGTGAVASAIISAEMEKFASPVTVETRSGEKIKVYFEIIDGYFRNVSLEGKAQLVFEGKITV